MIYCFIASIELYPCSSIGSRRKKSRQNKLQKCHKRRYIRASSLFRTNVKKDGIFETPADGVDAATKTKQGEHRKLEREATHRTRAGGPGRQVRPRRQWPTLPLTRLDDGERQGRRAWVPSRPNQRVENKIKNNCSRKLLTSSKATLGLSPCVIVPVCSYSVVSFPLVFLNHWRIKYKCSAPV